MRLPLPEGEFRAFLFDCDGTIADSMPLHHVAWTQALAEHGCTSFTAELFYGMGGMPVPDVIAALNRRDGLAMPVEAVAERKEALYYELLAELKAVPEVLEHIEASHGRIPFAVVSGSTRESVVKSLETLGLLGRFDTLVCAGDYARGKPDPEPFLLAAERLGVAPEHCLVFEDAEVGVASAKAAGMAWVKVPDALGALKAGGGRSEYCLRLNMRESYREVREAAILWRRCSIAFVPFKQQE